MAKKRIIEVDVMGNKNTAVQEPENLLGHFRKNRAAGNHLVIDARHHLYGQRNGHLRVQQGVIAFQDPEPVMDQDRYFSDAVCRSKPARRFYIYDGILHPVRYFPGLLLWVSKEWHQ